LGVFLFLFCGWQGVEPRLIIHTIANSRAGAGLQERAVSNFGKNYEQSERL